MQDISENTYFHGSMEGLHIDMAVLGVGVPLLWNWTGCGPFNEWSSHADFDRIAD
jgi:hypothetical protein